MPAKKESLVAEVFVRDIQALYLTPYEFGGKSIPAKPGNVAMLNPKGIGLNSYGNIPYQKVKKLLGNKARYFIGTVKTAKGGPVSGLWERIPKGKIIGANVRYSAGKNKFIRGLSIRSGPTLKLLVRFTDPVTVKKQLGYFQHAEQLVPKVFPLELKKAMRQAIASAK